MSVFFEFLSVSASYRDPNSWSCDTHSDKMVVTFKEELTTRYFSEPLISTEFTTLIILLVGSYASRYGFPAKALSSDVFPDPAAPQT